ncbi:KIR protein [Plasmodium coatneyi]|uniref:KIR protein n=1 Tax=Plasmodium coatneyi TaxID=208452 RepID=A0A1B1DTI0_9APIC|nr:KIR protein [Plasmodium coatneyi]ANQ06106.1 KIR protein [Plasmodium coatneyi]
MKLPSYRDYYKKFNGGCNECDECDSTFKQKLQSALQKCPHIDSSTNMILKACCCISQDGNKEGPEYKKKCNFFYYWALDKLIKEDKSCSFSQIVEGVISALENFLQTDTCEILDSENIGEDIIKDRKTIFEYWHNYNDIQLLLRGSGSGCAQKYINYIRALDTVYKRVQGECKSQHDNPYCEEFQKKQDEYDPDKLLNTTCPTGASRPEDTAEKAKQLLKEKCQKKKLPSEKVYCELNNTTHPCSDNYEISTKATRDELKNMLQQNEVWGSYEDQIVLGFCYASKMNKGSGSDKKYCQHFYYWLQTMLYMAKDLNTTFGTIMKNIYRKLKDLNIEDECTEIYANIEHAIYQNMRTVFDYTQDYETIETCARNPHSSEPQCADKYHGYLQKVLPTYEYMSIKCPKEKDNNEKWCMDFQKMANQHSYDELLQLKCSLKHTPECTNITAAILGTLTSIGLPVLSFFLYKYNLLPSSFFNKFGKNSGRRSTRRGRSTGRHHFDDTFTEGDTSTTLGDSTENDSTIGSTLGSTTDGSTIYNGRPPPPTRGRGRTGAANNNNNRRGGESRKNISYQRI